MPNKRGAVPVSQTLGMGQRDKDQEHRDTAWDRNGTGTGHPRLRTWLSKCYDGTTRGTATGQG